MWPWVVESGATGGMDLGTLEQSAIRIATLRGMRYLIIDRDAKYTDAFRRLVSKSGYKVIRLPPMSPNLNAYAERFVRSIKDECLNRMRGEEDAQQPTRVPRDTRLNGAMPIPVDHGAGWAIHSSLMIGGGGLRRLAVLVRGLL